MDKVYNGVRNQDRGRHHNQRMSLWEYGKDIDYLTHKSAQACIKCFTDSERGTSSHSNRCQSSNLGDYPTEASIPQKSPPRVD